MKSGHPYIWATLPRAHNSNTDILQYTETLSLQSLVVHSNLHTHNTTAMTQTPKRKKEKEIKDEKKKRKKIKSNKDVVTVVFINNWLLNLLTSLSMPIQTSVSVQWSI